MAFCSNCGANIPDGSKFCPECGTKMISVLDRPPANNAPSPGSTNGAPPEQTPAENMFTYTPETQSNSYYTASTYSYDPSASDIPGGIQTKKERKSSLVPILLILLGLVVIGAVLFFVLRGRASDFEAVTYNAVSGTSFGRAVDVDTMWPDGFSVELISGNKCVVAVDGKSQNCSYDYDKEDGEIEINLGKDNELEGRIRGDTLYLEDVLNTGVDLTFLREGAQEPAAEPTAEPTVEPTAEPTVEQESAAAAEETAADDYWVGDWYGWWIAYNGTGDCASLNDYAFDSCASITKDADGSYVLELWDLDCDKGENISHCYLTHGKGYTENGRLVSEEGYFFDYDFGAGDWIIDPGDSIVSEFDHMICIRGSYVDVSDSSSTMDYYIFLRPWGMSWDDVRSADMTDMPYDDMMPIYYDDWYVPRMNGTMPAYFNIDFDDPD